MSNNTTKLQVPIDKDVLAAMKKHAHGLGFDSAQAYIRFLGKAIADGRQLGLGYDDWGEPSPKAVARWEEQIKEMEAERKAGKAKVFDNAEEALDYLHNLK